uniref:40S ribosomal protein S29-like n=1 Tax=Rhizophora mucronata TaxID=61149 RepID=A0A2P2KGD5_RHIMU
MFLLPLTTPNHYIFCIHLVSSSLHQFIVFSIQKLQVSLLKPHHLPTKSFSLPFTISHYWAQQVESNTGPK